MKITEKKAEGLRREYKITVPGSDVQQRIDSQLQQLGGRVKIDGFRPGKVPMAVLRQRYGDNVRAEALEQTVNETIQQLLKDKDIRPAMPPKAEDVTFDEGKDLEYSLIVEIFPDIDDVDFAKVKLDRPVFEVSKEEIDEGLTRLAEQRKTWVPVEKARKAKSGDVAIIDFKGSVDGKLFDGGTAEKYPLKLGSGNFIEGFEDQVIGLKPGENTTVKVTFPENYGSADLAGKAAEFEVTLHEIREEKVPAIDDNLAKAAGAETMDKLRESVAEQIKADFEDVARNQLKKQLFDRLSETCKFELPKGMVDMEFDMVWKQIEEARQHGALDEETAKKSDKELQKEYREVAERRVKLGLFLAETGNRNKLTITQDDIRNAVMQQMKNYPGQEQQVIEYYQDPKHMEELRGPIIEDKSVDFILAKVSYNDIPATIAELREAYNEGLDWAEERNKKGGKKKAAAKEAPAKKAASAKGAEAKKSTAKSSAKSTKKKAS